MLVTKVSWDKGVKLYCSDSKKTLVADPTTITSAKKSKAVFITHAHTDHTLAFPNKDITIYANKLSSLLYSAITNKKVEHLTPIDFYEKKTIDNAQVKLYPAGHLLGASQILFLFNDVNVLYTGDISTSKMITVSSAEVPNEEVDILIIESTYGTPNLFFETRDQIKSKIFHWIVNNLKEKVLSVINIGAVGPAQEIIAFLNQLLSIDIYCPDVITKINEIYVKNNIPLKYIKLDHEIEIDPSNSVILLPRGEKSIPQLINVNNSIQQLDRSHLIKNNEKQIKISRGIITGQASRFSYSKFNKSFPFSMHANAKELLNYIKEINPKKVYTVYGFESELAMLVRKKLKIFSRPLKLAEKSYSLDDFF